MNLQRRTLNDIHAEHICMMRRAIKAAERARGTCSPNPFVGAVIVKNGKVIAEGWTQEYGADHAEVQALKKAGKKAQGADMYVTLEPCSHYGKTPPCADAIIQAGIKHVYIGIGDPNPLVNGKGIKKLREAGISVTEGVLASQISKQLEYFLCRIQKERPFVIWKSAVSLDGKYAAQDGSSRWISGESSRKLVHRLRSEVDVVLTGINTVLCDDPMLNARLPKSKNQTLRVVLDPNLLLPLKSKLALTALEYPILIFCRKGIQESPPATELKKLGVRIKEVAGIDNELNLLEVLRVLHQQGHYSVLLECGNTLSSSFFQAKLVDKCLIFIASKIVGGEKAMLVDLGLPSISDAILFRDMSYRKVGEDILVTGYPVY